MSYRVRRQDMEVAIRHLQRIVDIIPVERRDDKVYFECEQSFSWPGLVREVEKRTDFGRSYVRTLVSAARAENLDLESYLKGPMR